MFFFLHLVLGLVSGWRRSYFKTIIYICNFLKIFAFFYFHYQNYYRIKKDTE